MRGVRAWVGLGALLALVACDSERPEPAPQPAAPVQQAAEPERREPEAPAVPPAAPPETAAEAVPAPAAPAAPAEQAPAPPAAPEPQPAPKVITQPPAQPKPAAPATPPAVPKPPVPSQPAAPVALEPVSEPEPAPAGEGPLDLSLPGDLGEALLPPEAALLDEGSGEGPPERLLPPLFKAEEDRQSSFELGGRLITNEGPEDEEEGYWDTVEGAELQLHFRR